MLHYFDRDFVNPGSPFDRNAPNIHNGSAHTGPFLHVELFNGNISARQEYVRPPADAPTGNAYESITGNTYRYDQLNRLTASYFHPFDGSHWQRSTAEPSEPGAYDEFFSYDKNGNFQNVLRYVQQGSSIAPIDEASYYNAGTNQLGKVTEFSGSSGAYEGIRTNTTDYTYDLTGNLTVDVNSGLGLYTTWSPRNKINAIVKSAVGGTLFSYDAMGNRVRKLSGPTSRTTYYIYDAGNNLLATYEGDNYATHPIGTGGGSINVLERYLYGNDRIGSFSGPNPSSGGTATAMAPLDYELTDHLGNVRAVVRARRGTTLPRPADPDMKAYYNYYAFGSMVPDRVYNGANSRHSFNGKEKDDEFLGLGNLLNFGARSYDPWVGRFWSMDPFTKQFPQYSPYLFAGNNPIYYIDKNGDQYPAGKQGEKQEEDYPLITKYLKTQVAKDIERSTKIINAYINANPNLTPNTIKGVYKWAFGPVIEFTSSKGLLHRDPWPSFR